MALPWPVIAVTLAVTLVVAVLAVHELAAAWEQRRRFAARSALDEAERRANTLTARLDARLRRTDLGRAVGRRLTAAGLRIRVSTFLLLALVSGGVAGLLIGRYLAPVFGVAAAAGVGFVFLAYLRRREGRRREEFIAQLPELARVLSNATSAGLALRTAIEMAADELDDPAGTELGTTANALRLGQPFDEAMQDLGERLPSRELAVLVSTLVVATRSGGSLVTALRTIAATLEDRKEIRREVQTIMGEAVISNWAIGILGIGSLVLVNTIQPGALRAMSENLVGQIILGTAAACFVLSLVIIRRITRIDV
jgi:tight adherence protein B